METPASNGIAPVPQIRVIEATPLVPNNPVVSAAEKAVSVTEKAAPAPESTSVQIAHPVAAVMSQDANSSMQATSTELFTSNEVNSSGGFTMAPECTDCVVAVQEPESQSVEGTIDTSEPDQDDFRTESTAGCCSIALSCLIRYEQMWDRIDNRCRLPFWLLLMAVPIFAGVIGSFYMYSCPAAATLPSAVFSIGMALMAVMTIRVCIIFHRMSSENEDSRRVLHTLLLISMFVTVIFFATESAMFWQMDSTSEPGSEIFCDPTFVKYTFWWNCLMSVVMVPLFIFPA